MIQLRAYLDQNRLKLCIAGCLILIALLIFWPLTQADFVNYDDPDFVTANSHVLHGLVWPEIVWAFTALYIYWQPMTWMSYMVDSTFYGDRAGGFHTTNILLHLLSTVFLFFALNRMTREKWPSAMVAALFALHPLHVENVAWISERKGVLSGFFWMLTVYSYVRYAERPNFRRYLLVALSLALGLMSKPILVTLPCVLLLLDFWPLQRFEWASTTTALADCTQKRFAKSSTARLLLEKLPLLFLSALSCIVTILAQNKAGSIYHLDKMPLRARLPHAIVTYWIYIKKAIWPTDLTVFYPFRGEWPVLTIFLAAVVLSVISGLALWHFRRRPYLACGWLLFLGVLLPVSGLFQSGDQAYADRYMYLPLIGLSIMIVWVLWERFGRTQGGRATLAVFASVVTLGCGLKSAVQVGYWQNSHVLFAHACEAVPNNFLAETIYGTLLAEDGNPTLALDYFRASLTVQPKYADTHYQMGNALAKLGQFTNAIEHYDRAIEAKRDYSEAWLNKAIVQQHLGEIGEAITSYTEGLNYNPTHFQAQLNLGNLMLTRGDFIRAKLHLQSAAQLQPDNVAVLNRLAWLMATNPESQVRNGKEAILLAQHACDLTGNSDPQSLNTLAAAYAEAGQFEIAAATAERALAQAKNLGQDKLVTFIANLQALYKSGKPYRQEQ
jgi:tetratricopeptide (TPR) repeat protein